MGFPTRNLQDLVNLMAQGIGNSLVDTFGPFQVGFALVIFDLNEHRGERRKFAYSANTVRADVIEVLEDLLAKLKAPPAPADA